MNKKGIAPVVILLVIGLIVLFGYLANKNIQNSKSLQECNSENQRLANQLNDLIRTNGALQNQVNNLQDTLSKTNNQTNKDTSLTPSLIVSYTILDRDMILTLNETQVYYLISLGLALIIFIPLTLGLKIQIKRSNKGFLYILFWVFDILVAVYIIFAVINLLPLLIEVINKFFS